MSTTNRDSTNGVSRDGIETASAPPTMAKIIRYRKPELKRNRSITPLCRTDIMYAAVQVIKEGGENTLHNHTEFDGLWFVLKGRARFHGDNNEIYGELGERDAILIPRGVMYWFESIGKDDLELLQLEALTKGKKDKIIFHAPMTVGDSTMEIFSEDGRLLSQEGAEEIAKQCRS